VEPVVEIDIVLLLAGPPLVDIAVATNVSVVEGLTTLHIDSATSTTASYVHVAISATDTKLETPLHWNLIVTSLSSAVIFL
jgi:hypothetical protein